MSDWSERKNHSPAGVTPAEPCGPAPAPPVPASRLVQPSQGGFPAQPALVAPVEFPFAAALGDFDALPATGFEDYGLDLPQQVTAEPAPLQVEPAAPPVEILTPPAKVSIYEPLEIMDYEEFEPYAQPEPLPAPEPEPPAFVAQTLPVAPPEPASPPAAKPLPPLGSVAFAETPALVADALLPTLRPRVLRGPNPNAKPAPPPPPPEPAVVIETPKPATPPKPAPAPERPKVSVRPAPPAPEKDRRQRPAIAARDHGNAVPVEREEPQAAPPPPPPPAPKPKVMPMPARRPEPVAEPAPAPAAARVDTAPTIGLPASETSGLSNGLKIAIAGVVLAVLGTGGYFLFSGKSEKRVATTEATPSSLVVGGGGWTTTWGSDAAVNKNKQISIYRPSMAMSDYRFEFRGQIERKALGWIFRAANSKNYYVMKLETIKPGPNPLVALVKYAVIDGKETTRTQVMLPFEVKMDTLYQVRLDVSGDKFSTWVQGKLVDFWTDSRIKVGGAGFYADAGERASIKSSQLSYLSAASAQ